MKQNMFEFLHAVEYMLSGIYPEEILEARLILEGAKTEKYLDLVKKWTSESQNSSNSDSERAVYKNCAKELLELV